MRPMAYVEACTTTFHFREFFFTVPMFACWETSEKILTQWLFLRKTVVLQETYPALGRVWLAAFALLAQASYHQAADVAKANNQTGLTSGSLPTWAHQGIALGVYGTAVPTLPRVALWGPCGSFLAINDQHVAMMLTWPWWSLEGSLLVGCVELATLQKKSYCFSSNSSVGEGLNSKCPRPTTLLYASWVLHAWERKDVCILIIEKL